MVNPIEIIGSLVFLLLAGWIIYHTQIKPRQQAKAQIDTKKENFFTRISGKIKAYGGKIKIKKPELGLGHWIVIIIVVFVGVNYVWDNGLLGIGGHTTTITFPSQESLTNNLQITGNVKVENGCMMVRGPATIKIKNSENMKWTDINIVPCGDREFNELVVRAGTMSFESYIGPPPPPFDANPQFNGFEYYVGIMTNSAGERFGSFLPITNNVKVNDIAYTLEIQRGAIITENYKMFADNGFSGSIVLTTGRSVDNADGVIQLEIFKPQGIKIMVVREGLPRI